MILTVDDFFKALNYSDIYSSYVSNGKQPVHGWTTSYYADSVKEFLQKQPLEKQCILVEVGTWMGASAIQAADIIRDLGRNDIVICVDTWLGSPEHFKTVSRVNGFPTFYYTFLQNVVNHGHQSRIVPIPLPSLQALPILHQLFPNKVDLIYIDAAHEYLPVYLDVVNYWNLLKQGGRMLGDDYTENWPEVKKAVNQFSEEIHAQLIILNEWVWKIDKN